MKIDFVVLWVDGADEKWRAEKEKYAPKSGFGASAARYRDWGTFRYWFRGVEKFAPWVNTVYFITWGHLPPWLNTEHPKLKIVKHTDYIPSEYLPTFNSNVIELNLHRIPELSEHFVLFNDDTFLINKVAPEDFFRDGKPCDQFLMNAIVPHPRLPIISHTSVNNVTLINKYFFKKKVIRKMPGKVFSIKYGSALFRNLLLLPWGCFTGFGNPHLPLPHLKSTFSLLWEKEEEKLHGTCVNRFRTFSDLNHWVMRYWNLCSGTFVPRKGGFGTCFTASRNNQKAFDYIRRQKGKTVCINDSSSSEFDVDLAASQLSAIFESLFPEKSGFER